MLLKREAKKCEDLQEGLGQLKRQKVSRPDHVPLEINSRPDHGSPLLVVQSLSGRKIGIPWLSKHDEGGGVDCLITAALLRGT